MTQEEMIEWLRKDRNYLRAEAERLRSRLALAETAINCFEKDRIEQEAEIERLRAALEPMLEHFRVGGGKTPIGAMLENARRALEQPAP